MKLELAARAKREAVRHNSWWRANRELSPDLFERELLRTLEHEPPELGTQHGAASLPTRPAPLDRRLGPERAWRVLRRQGRQVLDAALGEREARAAREGIDRRLRGGGRDGLREGRPRPREPEDD